MAPARQTVRVFVSSTFRDMHAERDVLARTVFPELRSRCARRGVEFIGVDLRWGITEDESRERGALRVCLEEIERCRPFFVGLIGDRFGWIPAPEDIPGAVFEAARAGVDGQGRAWFDAWYLRDDTSDPPVYRLRHDRPISEGTSGALARFWNTHGLELAGESITSREILRGAFAPEFPQSHVFFYLREPGLERDLEFPPALVPVFADCESEPRARLDALKARIRSHADSVVVRDYRARYAGLRVDPALLSRLPEDVAPRFTAGRLAPDALRALPRDVTLELQRQATVELSGMEAFGEQVLDDLWAAIEKELEQPAAYLDDYERDRAYHERFIVERTRLFLGREDEIDRVAGYVTDPRDTSPLVLTGPAGCGKSALLAEVTQRLRGTDPALLVVPYFIGAAPGSTDLTAALRAISEALLRGCGLPGPVAADPDVLRAGLPALLASAGEARSTVLVLDSLDQLDPAGRSHELAWLPLTLPPGVKLIVSTLAADCLDRLRSALPGDHILEMPALSERDRIGIVRQHLALRRKTLTRAQVLRLLDRRLRPDAVLPLYVLVALEELCLFGDFHALDARIDRLPPTLPELFEQVLARLEQDHGHELPASVCRQIAASRHGLLESEVLDLQETGGRDVPRVRWTRLYRALEFHLRPVDEVTGAGLLGFYHQQLRAAVYRRYFGMVSTEAPPTDAFRAMHARLAAYFSSAGRDDEAPLRWRLDRPRSLGELVYHEVAAERWEEVEATLTDLGFAMTRARLGMVYDLARDFQRALSAAPRAVCVRLEPWEQFIRAHAHLVARGDDFWPADRILFQLAVEHGSDSPVSLAADALLDAGRIEWTWLRLTPRPAHVGRSACLRVFEGHAGGVSGASELAGGRAVSWGWDRAIIVWDLRSGEVVARLDQGAPVMRAARLPGERLASWSGPTLLIWDLEKYRLLHRFDGHHGQIANAVVISRGALVTRATGNYQALPIDNTLRVWDPEAGRLLHGLSGHSRIVRGARELEDGRLVSWDDWDLRIWDLGTGAQVSVIAPPEARKEGSINGAVPLPDGLIVLWLYQSLQVWDLRTGLRVALLKGHTSEVSGALVLGDGRLVSWAGGPLSSDSTLRVWHPVSGVCEMVLQSDAPVEAVIPISDGRLLSWPKVSAGAGAPAVWDVETGRKLARLDADVSSTFGACQLRDGHLLTWGHDGVLRVWDSGSYAIDRRMGGHGGLIHGALELSNGRLLSWSSDKTLRLWDSGAAAASEAEGVEATWSHTGLLAPDRVLAMKHPNVALWDASTATLVAPLDSLDPNAGPLISGWLRIDDLRFATWPTGHVIVVRESRGGTVCGILDTHTAPVHGLAKLGDGRLASWSADETLVLWNWPAGTVSATLRGWHGYLSSVTLLPGDRLLAVAALGDSYLWNLETGDLLAALKGTAEPVSDDRLVSYDWNRLHLWNARWGHPMADLLGHTGCITGMMTLPGDRLVTWCAMTGDQDDGSVRVWDLAEARAMFVFEGPSLPVDGVIRLERDRLVSWAGWVFGAAMNIKNDPVLRVWDLATGRSLGALEGHTDVVEGAVALPGDRLLSWSRDGTIRLWHVPSREQLEVESKDNIPRTHPEWLAWRAGAPSIGAAPAVAMGNHVAWHVDRSVGVSSSARGGRPLGVWHADEELAVRHLLPDGTLVVTRRSGGTAFLKLFDGRRRLTLDEFTGREP